MNESELRRKRVALVVLDYASDGGLKSVAKFLQNVLQESEYDYTVISLATSRRDSASTRLSNPATWWRRPRLEKRVEAGFTYWHVGSHLAELEFMRYMPRLLLTHLLNQFDLVQMVAGSPAVGVSAWFVRKPLVLKTATLVHLERQALLRESRGLDGLRNRMMTFITRLFDGLALRRADAVVVVNKQMATRLEYLGSKVNYIPSGIDTDFFSPDPLTPQRDFILSVGRFDDPRKNPSLLFHAYRKLLDQRPDAPPLVLAGKTMPSQEILSLLDDLQIRERVQLYPDVSPEQLRDLYRRARVFWLTSDEEGQGLVLVEAMACGVPVISTRCGGPESIIEDGLNGFLVPLGDAEAIAARTGQVMESARWNALSRAAQQHAVNTYSSRVSGKKYLTLYGNLLADKESL